ncbi:MAG: ribosomal protein, partial [Rhodospirillales bacterium]|nr:ribosomal protein [Rhodospirillales bacterium]
GNKRHQLTAKTNKMKRQNRGSQVLRHQDGLTVMQWMPYGSPR